MPITADGKNLPRAGCEVFTEPNAKSLAVLDPHERPPKAGKGRSVLQQALDRLLIQPFEEAVHTNLQFLPEEALIIYMGRTAVVAARD